MGIYYCAVLMVGLPRDELEEVRLYELLDSEDTEECPASFDSNGDDENIVGFTYLESEDYAPSEVTLDPLIIQKLKDKFVNITGLEAKVYLSPRGG